MKIFQSVQKKLISLGFTRIQPHQQQPHPFDRQHGKTTLFSICTGIFLLMYISKIAHSPEEYMDTIYFLTALISVELSRANYICKTDGILILYDGLEKMINESK